MRSALFKEAHGVEVAGDTLDILIVVAHGLFRLGERFHGRVIMAIAVLSQAQFQPIPRQQAAVLAQFDRALRQSQRACKLITIITANPDRIFWVPDWHNAFSQGSDVKQIGLKMAKSSFKAQTYRRPYSWC